MVTSEVIVPLAAVAGTWLLNEFSASRRHTREQADTHIAWQRERRATIYEQLGSYLARERTWFGVSRMGPDAIANAEQTGEVTHDGEWRTLLGVLEVFGSAKVRDSFDELVNERLRVQLTLRQIQEELRLQQLGVIGTPEIHQSHSAARSARDAAADKGEALILVILSLVREEMLAERSPLKWRFRLPFRRKSIRTKQVLPPANVP